MLLLSDASVEILLYNLTSSFPLKSFLREKLKHRLDRMAVIVSKCGDFFINFSDNFISESWNVLL